MSTKEENIERLRDLYKSTSGENNSNNGNIETYISWLEEQLLLHVQLLKSINNPNGKQYITPTVGFELPEEKQSKVGTIQPDKGELNGSCNITRCQKPESAVWYNHSTRKHYCTSCARKINDDPYNKRDAMRLYGHDLCTRVDK